jgi:CheY-like chemotaxis protein/class 3 adenylate cyclase
LKLFPSKGIRFSGDSIKSCVGFIDLMDSTKNIATMEGLEYIRKYYSTFINSITNSIKSYNGKVIKNIGDCLLFYFPKTSDHNNVDAFKEVIDCGSKILNERYKTNNELAKQHLPPFNYRISIDYGVLDLALVGDYSQIDLFGSTINLCSKINSSSLSSQNEIIIGDNLYRVLKSVPLISNNYHFIENGEYNLTSSVGYHVYLIKRKNILIDQSTNFNNKSSLSVKQLKTSVIDHHDKDYDSKTKNNSYSQKKNKNKIRIILVDDEQDILFTYQLFLESFDYNITAFTDPSNALNYIRDLPDFNELLIILDIRMKNLNGFQLHQQIKSIDPTIKILFITALDILDELLSIIPGLSQDQIMRKPIEKKEFTNTVNRLLLN